MQKYLDKRKRFLGWQTTLVCHVATNSIFPEIYLSMRGNHAEITRNQNCREIKTSWRPRKTPFRSCPLHPNILKKAGFRSVTLVAKTLFLCLNTLGNSETLARQYVSVALFPSLSRALGDTNIIKLLGNVRFFSLSGVNKHSK